MAVFKESLSGFRTAFRSESSYQSAAKVYSLNQFISRNVMPLRQCRIKESLLYVILNRLVLLPFEYGFSSADLIAWGWQK